MCLSRPKFVNIWNRDGIFMSEGLNSLMYFNSTYFEYALIKLFFQRLHKALCCFLSSSCSRPSLPHLGGMIRRCIHNAEGSLAFGKLISRWVSTFFHSLTIKDCTGVHSKLQLGITGESDSHMCRLIIFKKQKNIVYSTQRNIHYLC